MARKRRKSLSEGSSKEEYTQDDAIPQDSSEGNVGKKQRVQEPCIVISDSDGEAAKEENGLQEKRGKLALDRRKTLAKRRIAQMSEEEQLALAVKMSEQEANHVNYSVEEEDELLRKAIEESLHCCGVSEFPERAVEEKIDKETASEHVSAVDPAEELPLSQQSDISSQGVSKSPVVILKRLSQDIVESNSVILSPNRDPFLKTEFPSNRNDFLTMSPLKTLALSPVFPRKSPCRLGLVPRKLFDGTTHSSSNFTEDLDDQCSHCSESSQQDSTPVLSSPPQSISTEEQGTLNRGTGENIAFCSENSNMPETKESATVTHSQDTVQFSNQGHMGAVHYYWGVPFCPKGEDPNSYTQVILCQLEVYQKSLKRAQRQLLNKMTFGEPVQLASSSLRRSERGRGDSQESCSQEESDDVKEESPLPRPAESEGEGAEGSEKSVTPLSSRRKQLFDSPVHSPQVEGNSSASQNEPSPSNSQTPLAKFKPGEDEEPDLVPLCENVVSTNTEGDKSPVVQSDVSLDEAELTICPETQPSPIKEEISQRNESIVLAEIHSIPKTSLLSVPHSDEDASLNLSCPPDVECPLCGQQFSPSQIEMHAAYCDGTSKEDKQEMTVLRPRQKIARSNLAGPSEVLPPPDSGK
ncbi:BRCA1-A complex subunit RAP80 isoform 2-T3 [Discoglossus pictus]